VKHFNPPDSFFFLSGTAFSIFFNSLPVNFEVASRVNKQNFIAPNSNAGIGQAVTATVVSAAKAQIVQKLPSGTFQFKSTASGFFRKLATFYLS
jgi:hypothetical protein